MAELLVVKESGGLYIKSDVVVVRPDGSKWGNEECLPKFYVFKVSGLSVDDAQKYQEESRSKPDPITGQSSLIAKRKYKFDFTKHLTANQRNSISTSDWLVLSIPENNLEVK